MENRATRIALEQGAGGAVGNLRHGADGPCLQPNITAAGGQHGNAAGPLGAVVVALGEEMLGQEPAQMGARSAGGEHQ